MVSLKKLAKKVKVKSGTVPDHRESLLGELIDGQQSSSSSSSFSPSAKGKTSGKTPTGFFAVYVGEERQRFVVPTGFLSHPLFKIMLEKSYKEFGFEQKNGLVVPCSVSAFREVVNAIERSNARFDFGRLVEEFI